MKHTSVKLNTPCEFIEITKINPLISKCQIKVCYVGDEPNRNRSIITKEVAAELAQSLPGSPIVGYFREDEQDFGEHERALEIKNGQIQMKDITKPYGFVDVNARCWFQKFLDDDTIVREYLVTEGYIWTGQYPESQRIMTEGNNHSMELDKEIIDGFWTKDNNGKPQFFIINEAIVSKLCILGEEEEPCFEGSTITKLEFSLEEDFKEELFSMMNKIQELLGEGGKKVYNTYAVQVGDSLWTALYSYVSEMETEFSIEAVLEEEGNTFAVLKTGEQFYRMNFSYTDETLTVVTPVEFADVDSLPTEAQFSLEEVEKFISEFKKEEEKICPKCGKPVAECECEDDDEENKTYSLEEYNALQTQYSELQGKNDELSATIEKLNTQIAELSEFKNAAERKDKEAMIESFYMLSEEDKKDVIDNIDSYSLEDIENKLSVICVRNKVSFNLDDDIDDQHNDPLTYGLEGGQEPEAVPAWILAVKETQKTM